MAGVAGSFGQGVTVGQTTGVAVGQLQGGHVLLLPNVVVGLGPAVAGFGAAVFVPGLFVGTILISAQLTNVSGSNPCQSFPVVHHHCNTQCSHDKPVGNLRVMV